MGILQYRKRYPCGRGYRESPTMPTSPTFYFWSSPKRATLTTQLDWFLLLPRLQVTALIELENGVTYTIGIGALGLMTFFLPPVTESNVNSESCQSRGNILPWPKASSDKPKA